MYRPNVKNEVFNILKISVKQPVFRTQINGFNWVLLPMILLAAKEKDFIYTKLFFFGKNVV